MPATDQDPTVDPLYPNADAVALLRRFGIVIAASRSTAFGGEATALQVRRVSIINNLLPFSAALSIMEDHGWELCADESPPPAAPKPKHKPAAYFARDDQRSASGTAICNLHLYAIDGGYYAGFGRPHVLLNDLRRVTVGFDVGVPPSEADDFV